MTEDQKIFNWGRSPHFFRFYMVSIVLFLIRKSNPCSLFLQKFCLTTPPLSPTTKKAFLWKQYYCTEPNALNQWHLGKVVKKISSSRRIRERSRHGGSRGCTPLGIIPLVICVSLVGEHISLRICVSWVGEHVPPLICVSWEGEHV